VLDAPSHDHDDSLDDVRAILMDGVDDATVNGRRIVRELRRIDAPTNWRNAGVM
jgi:hypothetical protein